MTHEGDSPIVDLTILMPCLNEAQALPTCIERAYEGVRRAGVETFEILVADNGSHDGSQELARRLGARVIDVPVRGYGAALLGGIAAARGRFVLMGDADGSYDFSQAPAFLEKLRQGAKLVVGSRLRGIIQPGAMPFLHRYLGNPVLTALGNLLFGAGLSDFHCGLRAFDRQAVLDLRLKTPGMEFASEMIIRARLRGLPLAEVPITYSPDLRSRPPHLRTWRDGWRHLRFLLLLSPAGLMLVPGALLFLIGTIASLVLLRGPVHVGRIVFDVHSLVVSSSLAVVGLQVWLTGLLARGFASRMGVLPASRWLDSARELFSLEAGLGLGLVLVLAGVAMILATVSYWSAFAFGPLHDISRSLRMAIVGTSLIVAGIQLIFASFGLSLLDVT